MSNEERTALKAAVDARTRDRQAAHDEIEAVINRKEQEKMAKKETGPKEAQLREQREQQAAKPAAEPRQLPAKDEAATSGRELADRLEGALDEALGEPVEVVASPKGNYETLKVAGKSIGYVTPQKTSVRVEIKETARAPFPTVRLEEGDSFEDAVGRLETKARSALAVAAAKEAETVA